MVLMLLLAIDMWGNSPAAIISGGIKGVVKSKEEKAALEYTTISLYNETDSTLLTGTISDVNGSFELKKVKKGSYYVVIDFIGFEAQTISNIKVENQEVNLGTVWLNSASANLEEVTVVSKQPRVDYKIDKKVIAVSKEFTSASMSAVEVLENVPSIRVDIEGNVSLRGNQGFTVLIDGKPSILDANDVLRQMPASNIQNIEIITNPSVKYNPDGTAGIINLITKKNALQGFNGLVNVNYGRFNQMGGDFLLNYKENKVNYFVGGQYVEKIFPGVMTSDRRYEESGSVVNISSDGEMERRRTKQSVNTGFSWDASPKDSWSIELEGGKFAFNAQSTLDYYTEREGDGANDLATNESGRSANFFNASTVYQHLFDQQKHELIFQANYGLRDGDEYAQNLLENVGSGLTTGSYSTEKGPSYNLDLKLDYTKPIGIKGFIEAGVQYREDESVDETALYDYDAQNDDFTLLTEFNNRVDYQNVIYSTYALYKGAYGLFGYQAGLRGEYFEREIKGTETFNLSNFDYFPTLHLSYQLFEKQQLMLSYSKRIDRPRGYMFEPFVTRMDMFNVRKGNPDLENEYIDAFEAGYVYKNNKSQFSLESYYRIKHNKIERVRSVYTDGDILMSFENVGTDYALGVESMFSHSLTPWWEFSLTGDLFSYRIEGVKNNQSFETNSLNWTGRTSQTWYLGKTTKLQIDYRYDSPTVTSQGRTLSSWSINGALKSDFFNRKLSATLQVRDIFASGRHVSIIDDAGLYHYQEFSPNAPFVNFSLSYRINNYKQKRGAKNEGNDGGEEL